jgi:hypothetical protein
MVDSAVDTVPDDLPFTEFLKHDVGVQRLRRRVR